MVELNPSQIGDITELKCQAYLIEQGWSVLVPIGNHQKYDLVIEKNNKFAIIIGNEGQGVSKELQDLSDEFIYIKMNKKCESLNAGVAASIILYELSR